MGSILQVGPNDASTVLGTYCDDTFLHEIELAFAQAGQRHPDGLQAVVPRRDRHVRDGIEKDGDVEILDAADDAPVVRDDLTLFFDSFAIDLDVVVSFQLRTRVNEVLRSALHQDHCQQPIMVARILAKGDVVAEAAGFLSGVWAQVAQVAELEGGECSINLNPAVGLIGAYSFEAFYNPR
jgi:hypothetical protein